MTNTTNTANMPEQRSAEEHYRRMAQAIYDTYALLDFAKSQFRHKNINPFLVVEIFQDIEASLGNVSGEAQLLNDVGRELVRIASEFRVQRDEAIVQAQNNELLVRWLEEMLKRGDQLLSQLGANSKDTPTDSES